MTSRIVIERRIAAPPEVIWSLVSAAEGWLNWQGTQAEISAVPGGVHRVNIRGDAFAGGEVVEVIPHRRIAFTLASTSQAIRCRRARPSSSSI